MNSNASYTETFQDMVYETILPSIRKYGSYQVESRLSEAMEQLAIKDKTEEHTFVVVMCVKFWVMKI